jgi:hypothetical protein
MKLLTLSSALDPKDAYKSLGKIHFTPLKFQGFFNFNYKVSKLAIYTPKVSKSDNLKPSINILCQIVRNSVKLRNYPHAFFKKFPSI